MAVSKGLGIQQRRAFKKLVCNSRERLYRMAYAWTHNPHLADDLVQQTLYKALSNQKQLKEPSAAEAWLFRILSNCLKDHYRARREEVPSDDLVSPQRETPDRMSEQQQLVEMVHEAVRQLPLGQCQVVTLVDLEGFTYARVAEILDIPVGTVMSRLCRGRRALREHLIDARAEVQSEPKPHLKRVK
jgi:RNA polymerase sigma-70 factor (ECF subfamily)